MSDEKQEYKGIFKSTFLFGFVQVFNILVKMVSNKFAAIFIGANGIGILGLFNSSIAMIQVGTGLGISQSAVRDISEANGKNNSDKISRIIFITNKVIIFTGLLGIIVTIVFSPLLSQWSFGNKHYTISFIWISLVVGMRIVTDGQLAILKGMRKLKALAKASMIGSIVGLITVVPLYYFFGEKGIVPMLIITAFSALFFSNYFVRKIKYNPIKLSLKEIYKGASPMIKMGIALMYVSFLGLISDYIIRIYIIKTSSVEMVGFFQAGITIISSYFGIVITAMTTDYYPRISAIHNDNDKLEIEVNRQSKVGLLILTPLIILFMILMPVFIKILYTAEFLISIEYIQYAVFSNLIILCSNAMGMVLLAKQNTKIFVYSVTFSRIIMITINVFAYKHYGLQGLGIASIIMAVEHIILMQIIMGRFYNIKFRSDTLKILGVVLLLTICAFYIKSIKFNIKYILGSVLFIINLLYSYYKIKTVMEIDLIEFLKNKLKKNEKNT